MALSAVAATGASNAEDGTWTNPAGGSWTTASNWADGVVANDWGFAADFGTLDLSTSPTISLNGARGISRLIFGDTTPSHDWTLATGSGGPLTLAPDAEISVANQTTTVSAVLAGTSGLRKTGAGTLQLSAINTYTGDTVVEAGTLRLAANSGSSGTLRGGTLYIQPGAAVVASAVNALGYSGTNWTRLLDINGGTFTTSANGDQGWGLYVYLTGGSILGSGETARISAGGGTQFLTRPATVPSVIGVPIVLREGNTSNLLAFASGNGAAHPDLEVSSAITSPVAGRGVSKDGDGAVKFSGSTSITGPFNVLFGNAIITGSVAATQLAVSGPGILSGTGLISAPVTVNGTLAPGDIETGTLRFGNTLSLAAGSTALFRLSKTGTTLDSDRVQGITSLALAGALNVSASGDALAPGDSFTLFVANSISGSFSSISLPPLPGALRWDTSLLTSQGRLAVLKGEQAITFATPPDATLGTPPEPVTATASSGLPVSFESSNPAVATISGSTLTLTGSGHTTITASQPGNDAFLPAAPVARILAVNKAVREPQTISFEALAPIHLGTPSFPLQAVSNSGLPVTFTSSNPAVASISGNVLSPAGAGEARITASQPGNTDFLPAPSVEHLLTVAGTSQTIAFPAPERQTFGNLPLPLVATASSGLAVSFTSSDPAVAAVNGNVLTLVAPGTIILTAKQPGNLTYGPAAEVSHSLAIDPAGAHLGITPRSLQLSLRSGEKLATPLSLSNPATGALDWQLPVLDADGFSSSLEGSLSAILASQASILATLPANAIPFSEGVTGTAIATGTVGNVIPFQNGNRLSTDLGGPLEYSDRTVRSSPHLGTGGRYFTLKLPGLFLFGAETDGPARFNIDGNTTNTSIPDQLRFNLTHAGRKWLALGNRRTVTTSYSIDHIVLIDDPLASQAGSFTSTVPLFGKRRLYYAMFVTPPNTTRPDALYETMARALLESLPGLPPGVAAVPSSGKLSPGATGSSNLELDTLGWSPGSYRFQLDPLPGTADSGARRIPVEVTVGEPALDFPSKIIRRATITGGPAEDYEFRPASTTGTPHTWSARILGNHPWVALSQTSGTTPSPIRLRFDPTKASTSPGQFRAVLEVTVPGSTYQIPVVYNIDPVSIRRLINDPVHSLVYAVNYGAFTGSLVVLNPATGAIVRVVGTGLGSSDIAINPDATRAYVINQAEATVTGIDLSTFEPVKTIAIPGTPYRNGTVSSLCQIAAGPGSRIFCTDTATSPNLHLLDFDLGTVLTTVTAASLPTLNSNGGFADLHYDAAEKRLYFTRRFASGAGRQKISALDASTDQLAFIAELPAGSTGNYLYGTAQLHADLDGNRFVHSQNAYTRPLGPPSTTLLADASAEALSAYGHLVTSSISVYNGQTGAAVAQLPAGYWQSTFTPDQSALILANDTAPYFRRFALAAAIRPPAIAIRPAPAEGTAIEENTLLLTWSSLPYVDGYRVYLGTDRDAVANATPGHPTDRGLVTDNALNLATPLPPGNYFWRIDALRGGTVIPGTVTAFGVAPLRISPSEIAVTAPVAALHQQIPLSPTDPAGNPVAWTATSPTSWISFPQSSGAAGTPVTVRLDPAGLGAGIHTGLVRVSSAGLTLEVPVTMELFAANLTRLKPDPARAVVYGLQPGVLNGKPGHIVAIDAATGSYLRSFALPHYALEFAVHPAEDRIYVPAAYGNKVAVIDLPTWTARPALTITGITTTGPVYPGRAGRLLLEDNDWAHSLRLIDTATGSDLGVVPTGSSISNHPLAVVSPDGSRIFRSAPARIQPVDLTANPPVALTAVEVPVDSSSEIKAIARSYDGSRTSIDNIILGPQLEVVGYVQAAVHALSRDGRLAVNPSGLHWTDSGFTISTFPAGYTMTCFSADDRFVVAWSETLAKAVSIAVGTPVGTSPLPGARLAASPAELAWPPVAGATSYQVYLGDAQAAVNSATTASPLRIGTSTGASFALENPLPAGFRYFWRFDAVTPGGTIKGTIYYFDVPFPQAFAPIQLSAGAGSGGVFATSPGGELVTGGSKHFNIYEPDPVNGGFRHREAFTAPDIDASSSGFGSELAFGHDVIATGDPRFSETANESGAAFLFKAWPSGGWFPDSILQPASPAAHDRFGGAVALSSNLLLVADGYGGRNQVTSFFQWPGWKAGPTLSPNPRGEDDRFGAALALDGTRAVVGAPGDGFFLRGSAFIFEYDPATKSWPQRSRLLPSSGSDGDHAGASVALSGNYAALGGGGSSSFFDKVRRVQVFQRNSATSWTQAASLSDPQPGAGTQEGFSLFGQSVLLQGDLLFVSAPYATHVGKPGGVVHVYRRSGSSWNPAAPIVSPTNGSGSFGSHLAFSKGVLFVAGSVKNGLNSGPAIHAYRIEAEGNLPPRFNTQPPTQIVAGRAVDLAVTVTDPEGAAGLTFGTANLPPGLTLSVTGPGVARITGTTTAAIGSEHWLRIPASDSKGAESIQTALVKILAAGELPVIAALPATIELEAGEDLLIEPVVTGAAPFTWRWQRDLTDLPGADEANLSVPWMEESQSGSYRVIVTNAAGSATSTAVQVTVRPADRVAGDWPTLGSAPDHDGHQAATLGRHRFAAAWTADLVPNGGMNPATAAGGRVFATPQGRATPLEVRAFALENGARLWSTAFPANTTAGVPSWHGGKLYVQHADGTTASRLWSLDATSGTPAWSQPNYNSSGAFMAPTVGDTAAFVTSSSGLSGFDLAGSPRFSRDIIYSNSSIPTWSDGKLYTWINGVFAQRDPATGRTLWSVGTELSQVTPPVRVPVIKGDKACLHGIHDVLCVDLKLRKILWSVPIQPKGIMPAIARDRVFVQAGSSVRELSLADGSELAVHVTDAPANNPLIGQPLLLNDHWVVTNHAKTWIYHRATGELVQTLPHGGFASYAGNRLLLAGSDSKLRAFHANAAPEFSPDTPSNIAGGDEAADRVVRLGAFAREYDPGDVLHWAIESVSHPALFRSLEIDATSGDLGVIYNPWVSGDCDVVVTLTDSVGNVTRQTIRFSLPPLPEPNLQVAATLTLNRQTGLYEHRITVTNSAAREVAGFDLAITGLPAGVTVNNASASANGTWFIHHRQPLAAGTAVTVLIDYHTPVRGTEIHPEIAVSLVSEAESDPAAGEAGLAVDRCEVMEDKTLLIEFTSVPGSLYEIQYSHDATSWKVSPVKVRAAGNRVQWIDRGPPRTDSPPSDQSSRFYRVREIPDS